VIRRRLRVRGRVQGVFYRDTVRAEAEARGVAGWARNDADGSVEVVLEGPEDAVAAVLARCRAGPPDARVDAVEVADEPPGGLRGFRVR
jgi:acylphosphatase